MLGSLSGLFLVLSNPRYPFQHLISAPLVSILQSVFLFVSLAFRKSETTLWFSDHPTNVATEEQTLNFWNISSGCWNKDTVMTGPQDNQNVT